MKLCFLTIMPSPYMKDFFTALHDDDEIDLQVLYQERSAPDTHWDSQTLPPYAKVMNGRWYPFLGGRLHHNPTVTAELAAADADLYIVQGYAGITSQRAISWLRKLQKPWVFWGERPGMRPGGFLRKILRDRALKPVLQGADAIAAIGTLAVSAYTDRLNREIPVVNIPYLCDLKPFQQASSHRVQTVSTRSVADSPLTVLYCGQLIERKGIDTLFSAFRKIRTGGRNVRLLLVGTGPLEASLKASLREQEAQDVEFAGFQPVEELPRYFAEADLFVLPSLHDGWGVVVNQALAAGLPLVCSEAVGAAHDLIREGWNGFRFDPGGDSSLAVHLQRLIDDAGLRIEMSNHSREFSALWTPEAGVAMWKELAGQLALGSRKSHALPQSSVSS